MTVFLDTNILLDALFTREPFAEEAWEIMSLGVEGKLSLQISTLSVVNAVYIAKKYAVSIKDVKDSLLGFSKYIAFIDLTGENVINKLGLNWRDFEDSIQYGSAKTNAADYIITRYTKDFKEADIIVKTPSEFLKGY